MLACPTLIVQSARYHQYGFGNGEKLFNGVLIVIHSLALVYTRLVRVTGSFAACYRLYLCGFIVVLYRYDTDLVFDSENLHRGDHGLINGICYRFFIPSFLLTLCKDLNRATSTFLAVLSYSPPRTSCRATDSLEITN